VQIREGGENKTRFDTTCRAGPSRRAASNAIRFGSRSSIPAVVHRVRIDTGSFFSPIESRWCSRFCVCYARTLGERSISFDVELKNGYMDDSPAAFSN
jgi:hypothetical protein